MFNFIKRFSRLIKYLFQGPEQDGMERQHQPEVSPYHYDTLPPGYIPIESSHELKRIPRTTLDVGVIAKVFQSPNNELITYNRPMGIRPGCGHHIYEIDEIVTPESVHHGLGGLCPYCSLEAAELLNQNLISLQQAEELSLYCSKCASHCDGCGRNNICVRHSQRFEGLDGKVILLCPGCMKKAEKDKFFKKTINIMLTPFIDYKRLPSSQERDDYDY